MKLPLLLLLALLALSASEHIPANNGLPLVRADYQMCATVEGPSMLHSPTDRMDYHAGQHFNDKGMA